MLITNCKMWAALLVAICACAWGGDSSVAAQERKNRGEAQDKTIVKGTLASVDADKNTVTVTIHSFNRATQEATDTDKTFPLAKDANILQDDSSTKLADLRKGYPVIVKLDGASAASISVDGGTSHGEFLVANLERNTITVIAGRNLTKQVYHLVKTTKVAGADGKAMLAKDLKPGTRLILTRSVEDDHTAIHIQALTQVEKK